MDLGKHLYELRKTKNISQEEAAEKLNVTRQTISKWETNQSQPDFDKIIPLCNLYGITTEELFGKIKTNKIDDNTEENMNLKKRSALIVSISIFLYFIAVIWIILTSTTSWINENLMISIFMLICAVATVMLVYNFMSIPKKKDLELEKQKKEQEKYDGIIALIFTCLYLLMSFYTMAWHITWLIWIVYAIIIEILHLIIGMKGNKNEE